MDPQEKQDICGLPKTDVAPVDPELVKKILDLVDGVEVDLDEPLDPENDYPLGA